MFNSHRIVRILPLVFAAALFTSISVESRRPLLTIHKDSFHHGAGIAGEGSTGVSIALTFNRTQPNSTEEGSKACERIEVVSEAIEVVYAFASESEPSKVVVNQIVCSLEGIYLTVRFLNHLTNTTIDNLLDVSQGGPRLMAQTLNPFGLRLVSASLYQEPKEEEQEL